MIGCSTGRTGRIAELACVVICLVLVTLVGCSPASTEPTTVPPTAQEPAGANGFAIYLLAGDVPSDRLATLSHLELEDTPLLAGDDFVSYARETHEIDLTASGVEAIRGLVVPVNGKSFAVCVDGRPIYSGAFWAAYSSLSFDGVVIETTLVSDDDPLIRIELGYPGADFFRGPDPRVDTRVMLALEQAGKLK